MEAASLAGKKRQSLGGFVFFDDVIKSQVEPYPIPLPVGEGSKRKAIGGEGVTSLEKTLNFLGFQLAPA